MQRIVVPATWFYEWKENEEKNIFYRRGQSVLYMDKRHNQDKNEYWFAICFICSFAEACYTSDF